MTRQTGRLAETFDILVVGGGIYGLMVAWEATLRGCRVALIERGDFAASTSFNSARTIHGGVRSLQRLALSEMFEYVNERRVLCTVAPQLVHRLPFLMPAVASATANPLALRAYFACYDRLTSRHAQPPDSSKRWPAPRFVGRSEFLELNPYVERRRILGGMLWHDAQLHSSERLAIALALGADARGAVVCNYVEATGLRRRGNTVVGVRARDMVTGTDFDIEATATVNATGPRPLALLGDSPSRLRTRAPAVSKAMNLVVASKTRDLALAGNAGGRLYFLAPWRGVTVAGTSHGPPTTRTVDSLIDTGDVATLLSEINLAFPRLKLTETEVLFTHRGLLPAYAGGRHARLVRDSLVHDHSGEDAPGLYSVLGVRYTTARATAVKVMDAVVMGSKLRTGPSRSAHTPVDGGDIEDYAAFEQEMTARLTPLVGSAAALRIARHFGTEARMVLARLEQSSDERLTLSPATDVTVGELEHVVSREMVVTLEDALLRRLDVLQTRRLDGPAISRAADIVGRHHGWPEARRVGEARALVASYGE